MIVHGQVTDIRFCRDGFFVFLLLRRDARTVTIARGYLHGIDNIYVGLKIQLSGEFSKHKKYGYGFDITAWDLWYENALDIERFLSYCFGMSNIQEVASELFKLPSGDGKSLRALLEKEEQLEPEVQLVLHRLVLRDFAGSLGGIVPSTLLKTLYAFYGSDLQQCLEANPYAILRFPGATLAIADALVSCLGVRVEEHLRLGGQILLALREAASQGHLYVRRGDLYKILQCSDWACFSKACDCLESENAVRIVENIGVYTNDLYSFEDDAARLTAARLDTSEELPVSLDVFIEEYEKSQGIRLADFQKAALYAVAKNRIFALTGKPGTGKTTLLRAFVRLFHTAKKSVLLVAPTGIAAKRLESLTSHTASTIHRALGYDSVSWAYDESCTRTTDTVIVDEASMVDQELIYRLLVALDPNTIVVLVGDDAQLPSVGPGNVLRELISVVPTVRLTQIFRQSERGAIVLNAHRISTGVLPSLDNDAQSEFQFVRILDEDKIVELIVEMAAKLKAKDANFQVLSPKYEGTVGIDALNLALRDRLNPRGASHPSVVFGSRVLYLGDRVIITKNLYDFNVYNGDVGKIVGCHERSVRVRIHNIFDVDREICLPAEIASTSLLLAYAVSVHRVQGQEYDTIVMPIVKTQGRMLQRNLLYTAVTRARKRVWLIGDPDAVRLAVANDKVQQRNTRFGETIVAYAESRSEKGPDRCRVC